VVRPSQRRCWGGRDGRGWRRRGWRRWYSLEEEELVEGREGGEGGGGDGIGWKRRRW